MGLVPRPCVQGEQAVKAYPNPRRVESFRVYCLRGLGLSVYLGGDLGFSGCPRPVLRASGLELSALPRRCWV